MYTAAQVATMLTVEAAILLVVSVFQMNQLRKAAEKIIKAVKPED